MLCRQISTIRVLIVDDHELTRLTLKLAFYHQTDIQLVGLGANGKEAIELVKELHPDVIILDLQMPVMDGIETLNLLSEKNIAIPAIILTTFDDHDFILRGIQAGAKGYLLKDTSMDPLANAIRLIHAGHTHLGPGLIEKVIAHISDVYPTKNSLVPPELAELTPREKEVLHLIAKGANNKEIAKTLFIAERTVKNHVTSILTRLNLRDRTQAAIFAHSFLSVFDNNL